jgi:hypothetical protein
MDKYELQKLRDLPIEGVAERLGLQVVRHKALCPFHDDHHASLSFSVRRNTYRCFVCGASGGTIDLVMHYLNKPFLDACRWLADEHNVILEEDNVKMKKCNNVKIDAHPFDASRYERFFERPWLNDEAKKFLFEERRLDPRVVRWCRLTSWRDKQGVPWLQIPYYDRVGKLIGIQNRNLTPSQPPQGEENRHSPLGETERGQPFPRFRFPQGSQCNLYGLPVLNLLKPGETLFITEGCSDCWAMLSAGHKAIAIPSATLLSKKDKELLESLSQNLGTRFEMWPDNDAPGERLFLQLKEVLPSLVHHQLPPGCKDYSDYYLKLIQLSEVVK